MRTARSLHFSTFHISHVKHSRLLCVITFLGTGTSTGVPVVGCSLPRLHVGRSAQQAPAAVGEDRGERQALSDRHHARSAPAAAARIPIPRLDFVLFTHSHSDHLMGLDDIRPFNFRQRETDPGVRERDDGEGDPPRVQLHLGRLADRRRQAAARAASRSTARSRTTASRSSRFPSPTATGRSSDSASAASPTSPTRTASPTHRCAARGVEHPRARRPAPLAAPSDALHHRRGGRLRAADRRARDVADSPHARSRPREVEATLPEGVRLAYDGCGWSSKE